MPNYSMDHDPGFWQAPERFQPLLASMADVPSNASFFAMGDADVEATPVAVVFDMEPGYVITRHAHPCERFEVVVRGWIDTGERILYPGDVMTSHAGEFYGPKTAGPEGCTTVEVFATTTGVYERIEEGSDGGAITQNLFDNLTRAIPGLTRGG